MQLGRRPPRQPGGALTRAEINRRSAHRLAPCPHARFETGKLAAQHLMHLALLP